MTYFSCVGGNFLNANVNAKESGEKKELITIVDAEVPTTTPETKGRRETVGIFGILVIDRRLQNGQMLAGRNMMSSIMAAGKERVTEMFGRWTTNTVDGRGLPPVKGADHLDLGQLVRNDLESHFLRQSVEARVVLDTVTVLIVLVLQDVLKIVEDRWGLFLLE